MKLRGDDLGFVAVCSRSEYHVVFIWLRVQLGGEGGGSEKFSCCIRQQPCYLAAGIC